MQSERDIQLEKIEVKREEDGDRSAFFQNRSNFFPWELLPTNCIKVG